jgi:hypothetical protein
MLKKEEIKNGNYIFNSENNTYHIIENVGDARSKGDRGFSTTPEDELSYTIVDIVSGKKYEGICECSHLTCNVFSKAIVKDIDIYLAKLEAKSILKIGKAKKYNTLILDAVNRFEKYKSIFTVPGNSIPDKNSNGSK